MASDWVGLSDEERNDCLVEGDPCEYLAEPEAYAVMKVVEAKLREKNAGKLAAEDKAGGDEPVAWMREGWGPDCGPYVEFYRDDEMGWRDRKEWTPLFTRPQPQSNNKTKD